MGIVFSDLKKSVFTVFLLLFVSFHTIAQTANVVVGGGATITCPAVPTATWTTPPAGITFSNWVRGGGVVCATANNALSGSGFNTLNAAASIAANDYYAVTITADATHTFILNNVFWSSVVSAGTCNFDVYYSNNGGPITQYGTTVNGTGTFSNTFTGSVFVAAGTSITVYLVPSGTTASGTTVRWVNGSSFNITVSSTFTEYPIRVPWQTINNPCGGVFTDSGGSGGNYSDREKDTITFCAPAGQYLYFNFTTFNTQSNNDNLIAYNGSTPASPQIGVYSGTTIPGTIISAIGGCITFVFTSNNSNNNSGWTANIICSSTPPPTNDLCSTAQLVTPDGTCVNGSTLGANDSWIDIVGCQTTVGVHPDVWYSFVATGTQAQFSVNTSGTFSGNAEIILVRGTCTGTFTLVGSQCGASPLSATFNGLTVGATYYYTISSTPTGTGGAFQSCLTTLNPASPPEQDCPSAIPICGSVYTQTVSYSGTGLLPNEINPLNSCLAGGERADVWYTFTVQNSGNLTFSITPITASDDYDWAVYNLTNANCSDIFSNAALNVSCNFSSTFGVTGPTGGSALNSQGAAGTPFNAAIPVIAGQTYVINVSNFSQSSGGYTINLSNTTAVITDVIPPRLSLATPQSACGGNQITLALSENILCSTIDATDFVVTGPGGPYTVNSVSSPSCSIGGLNTNSVVLNVSPSISVAGNYTVCLSGTSVTDLCGNIGVSGATSCVPFTIALTPAPTTSPVTYCQNALSTPLTATITGGPTATLNWYTVATGGVATSTAPTPSTTAAGVTTYWVSQTVNGCESVRVSITVTVNATITPLFASIPTSICNGASVPVLPTTSLNGIVGTWAPSVISNTTSATYTFTPSTAGTCITPVSYNITVYELPIIYPHGTNPSCNLPPCNGVATVDVVGGSTPYTYNWVNGNVSIGSTQTISNLCAGTYDITVTDSHGCTSSAFTPVRNNCIQIQSLLVDACETDEGYGEMVFFQVGQNSINVSSMNVVWPSNTWQGITTNQTYINNVNATITGGGILLPVPVNGVLPPNANVVIITGVTPSSLMSFSNLTDTLYVIFQNNTTVTAGHFGNVSASAGIRTLVMNFGVGCTDTVRYDNSLLINQSGLSGGNAALNNGAYVNYSSNGNASYVNNSCSIPFAIQSDSVRLTAPPPAQPLFNSIGPICKGVTPVPAMFPNTSTNGFTGTWSPNAINTSTTTTYTFTHTPGTCVKDTTITVLVKLPTQSTTNVTRCNNQLPYNWNGTNYNAAGSYTFTTTNSVGCDSLAILNLTVKLTTQSTTSITRCNNQLPFNWNGTNYNAAGTYTFSTTNAAGCDSLAIVNLAVKLTTQSTTNITRCNNQLPYNWNGTNYNAAGTYTFTTTNALGCDSLAIVNLSIKLPTQSTIGVTRCNNQLPYNWNGTNYNAAGSYTFTTTNAAGCDSLAIVNLTVKLTTQSTTSVTRCNNQLPYNWNGTNYNAAGSYTFTTTNSVGCDSLAIVNLTVKLTTQSTTNVTRCNNQLPYNWNGTNYNAAGSYTFTTTNFAGCDSLAIVNLTVTNTTQSITNITRCNNQLPYNWNGTNYNAAGIYTFTTTNTAGCDSLAIVNLTVTNTTQSTTNVTRCNNQLPYNWNGTNYNAAGAYTFTTTNAAGCDSLAIVNLTVKQITQSTTNVTRCNNQLPYSWNGTNYNAAGVYTFTTTNAVGCDSLAIVNLTVTNTTQSNSLVTVCPTQLPYSWNGMTFVGAGTQTAILINASGCDSLTTLTLSVSSTSSSTTNLSICQNQLPYVWNGNNYNSAGVYTFGPVPNSVNCDSIAILNLSIKQPTQSTTNIIRCNNQLPYNWNGTSYNTAGTFTFTTTNAVACDSLAIVNLTVTNTTQSITNITRCNNQLPYNWNGTNYNTAGNYTFTTTNAVGCDSLAIVNLTVTNTTQSITNITRCNNQLPYNWNGTNYNTAGAHTFTTINAAGCDSLAIVNLTVKQTTQSTTNVTSCNNQLPYSWNGTNYNAAGNYTFTTTNTVGCDSLAIVNLTVTNTTQSITNITRCNNQLPYNWNGTNFNAAGAYTYTTTNAAGCDSLAIVNLTVTNTTQSATNITRCNNQLPYNWNGTNYNTAGAFTFTTTNAAGCDSLAIVNLTVTNITQSITNITRCNNQLPYNWNGTNYNVAGSYTFTTTNAAGCDSLAIVNLTVTNTTQSITNITRCNNQLPYNWNGSNYNSAGAYTFITTNAAGCDSLAIVNLTVTNTTQSITNITRCDNQLPYNWNGTNYNVAGSYTFTTTNAAGCDSLAIVNLTVTNTTQSITNIIRCNNQLPYNWNGTNYNAAGSYTFITTNAVGCDSLAIVNLTVTNTTQSITNITRCNNQLPYNWNGTNYNAAGSYTYTTTNSAGCDSLAIVNLTLNLTTQSTTNITQCNNQLPYNWNGTNYNVAGTYTFTTTNAAGCDSLAIVNFTVTNTTQSITNIIRCNNQLPYNWNGTNYNAAGTYTFTTTNAAGCDSLAIVNLTVNNTTQSITNITRCNNQLPYNWNGTDYNAVGAYTFTTTNAAGCDSLAIVSLTVTNTTQSIINITRCDNQLPYNWNGTNYNTAGNYTFTTTNAAGCDSLAIVDLTITNVTQSTTNITRCNNQLPYNWNGTNYNAAGSYTFSTTNAAGCDSLAIVNLTVTNTTQSITNITRCNNQLPYNWNGTNYNAAGSYTFTTTNAAGCDSLAIVNLTITNTTLSTTNITRCNNQLPYNWNGTNYNAASSYTFTTTNAVGCDSLAIVNLTVTNTTQSITNIIRCNNQLPYNWNGTNYNAAGSYTFTTTNAAGCDSLAIVNLTVTNTTQSITNIIRCNNQLPYNWNGTNYNAAGSYTFITTNAVGCDSLAIVNLTVTNTTQSITNITRCDNQLPFNWNGTNYNAAGSYTYTTTNSAGCDSLAIVNLIVTNTTQSITNITRCNNQLPYNWNGTNYNAASSYTFTTTNAVGCDSLAIVNLTVTNTTQSITNIIRCNNQLPYNWNGTNYSAPGAYTFTTTNAAGCDSLAIVNLTVTNTTQSITNITRCDNQLPYNWNGINYNAAGSYTFTTTNTAGCDSLAIVNLSVTNTTQSTSLVTVCPAQLPYIWNGLTFVGAGTQTVTLTNFAGCDSLATLILNVSSTSSSTTNLSLCQNQLPYVWNGNNYNTAGAYTFGPVPNSVNCDSIAILNLTIKLETQSTTNITRCNNQLPYNWNGTNYNTAGNYTFTTTNTAGCDSLAIVNLTITNTTQSITNITRCDNQLPYNWNGTNYNAAGSYTFTTTNASGCDSLAIVNLTVTNTTQSITNITLCNNQLPYNWNGTNYNAAGSYTFSTTNAAGCDSLAIVNLTVTNTTQSITNITRCDNQLPFNWNGTDYNAAGAYTFTTTNASGCDSLAIVNLTVTNTTQSTSLVTVCPSQLPYVWNGLTFVGAGTQTVTLTNFAGCDSLATLTLNVSSTSSSTTNLSLCQNQLPYVWNGNNYNTAGAYTFGPVPNSVNCDSIAILNLTIKLETQSTTNITRCNNQLPYNWNGTDYNAAGSYTFSTTNAAGCDSLAIVDLTITNVTQSIANITRCNNQLPYNWNGTNYNAASSYTFTTTNAVGCDSLAIVNLTVTNITQSITNIIRCNNQLPYNWNGTNYSAAGAYTFTTTNAAGCDSLAIVNLTVTNTTLSITNITRCDNQLPYNWNGTNYNAAGTYTFTTTNAAGCDSLAIVNLTITNTTLSITNITRCDNQLPFNWNGTNYNAAGSYTFTTTNASGCDSLAIVNLTITNTTQSTTNITRCNNELPYNWNGTNYNAAGSYTFTTTNAAGCDSLAIVNLTITNTSQSITNITRCNNQLPYNWNGISYNAAGSYTFTTTNAEGCDSLAIVNLTVTNTTQSITNITRCNNQLPFNWNGTNYNAAGAYTFTTTNASGCDSLAIVNLTLTNTTQSITNITLCNNQLPYNWNVSNYNAAGVYTFTTTNTVGCDSLAIVNLTVTNTTQSASLVTVCPAQLPYVWNGLTFVGAGTQTVTLTNFAGCDSLATLTLNVSSTSSSTTNLSLCQNQLPYVWNGNNYNTAGAYTFGPVPNSVNCDSIAILNLTIKLETQSITNITRCDNQLPFNWNGTNYNAAGSYTFTTTNAVGCDSLAIVDLTITNVTQSIANITLCNNQLPFNWNGTNYNAAGNYTFTTTNAAGCDSLAIVSLTVTNTTQSIINITRCDNQLPYNWNGTNYNAAGSYTFSTTNAAGCDSLAIVDLTITNVTQSIANITRCNNQLPYSWNGTDYNVAGAYTFTTMNAVGCDSLAIVNLTVTNTTQSTINVTLCNNQLPYNWNGTNYNSAGSYTFSTTNAVGCDSLAIVNLTITNTTLSITNITRCDNQLPYNWNGTNYNAAGSYTYTTTNAAGCDSLAIVNLTITNTTQSITNITRCNNQLPFNWNGTNYNAAGSYTFSTTNAVGCDSLAIVNLTITNSTQSITNTTLCNNQLPYNWNGTNYNAAGSYTYTTTNAAGCDSLAIVNLTITNTTQSTSLVTVCPAQLPYIWNGLTFVGAGTQTATLTNVAGCDSSATLTLSVSTTSSSTTNLSLCQSQLPYVWNGTSYNSAGSYTYGPVTNSVNCDSIAILNLSINQPTQSTTSITLCNNQLPYNWNGTNYNTGGSYTFTTSNAAGCDSLAIVNLTVTNTTQSITNITLCNNQLPYNWNGTNYNAAGSYTFSTTNAVGCDSLAIVNLTVTNTTLSITNITRCNNQLPYNWNGTNYNAAGSYTFITTNAAGCDSLAIVNLTVNNTTQSTSLVTVCPSQLPFVWNGLTFVGAGTQTATLTNFAGCDSLATLTLNVSSTSSSTTNLSLCQNQLPYVWNGNNYNSAGSYTYGPVTNTVNCDSIAILNLTINQPSQSTTSISLCNNQLPYNWNGTIYNTAGTYTFTTTNAAGCDSFAIVNLTVTNTTQSITNTTLCNNQLPYNWNGTNCNVAGAYTFTTTSASGCDSLAIVNLTITNTTQSITNITRCNNQLPYSWNGTNYNAAGTYAFTTTNTAGCDSLAIVNLTVTNTTQSITSITRCNNQLPYNWNGINYNAAGSYTFTTTNAVGCDSLAIVNLTITNTTQSITNITRCNNQLPYNWNGTNYNAAGSYTYTTTNAAGCDSLAIVNLTITNTTQSTSLVTVCPAQLPYIWNGLTFVGAGTQTATLTNVAGCDSSATLTLSVSTTSSSTTNLSLCQSQLPYVWNGTSYNSAGSYTYGPVTNSVNCDSIAILNLSINQPTQSTTSTTLCNIQLPYNWNGTNYNAAGTYTFTTTNTAGCDSLAIVNLTVTNTTQSITNTTLCNNQLPYNWNGTNYNVAGAYTFTTTSASGCDSLAIVNLTITNTTQSITNITRCNNQLPYSWNGTNYNAAGTYTFTTTNTAGCDSLAIVNLTVTNTTQSITSITRCNNQLPYNWNGTDYNAAGAYTFTTTNAVGCDSLAIVNLTVTNTTQSTTNITRCNNQLPFNWNGTNYNAAGSYTFSTTNAVGCDSLAIVNLTVTNTTQSITNITRCDNQLPYNWNGTNYNTAGAYTFSTTNTAGCDSLAIVNLTITNTTQSNSLVTVCPAQLPYIWNGLTFVGAGTQTATLTNVAGCDSSATLTLSVSTTSSSTTNLSLCQNQLPYVWNGTSYNSAGSYTYGPVTNSVNCDSIAILNLSINQPTQSTTSTTLCNIQLPYNWNGTNYNAAGTYTFTTTNTAGCDSLVIVNLTVTNTTQSITNTTLCNNQLPYNWNGTNYNVAGAYTFTTTSASGCDSLAIVNLTITNTTQSNSLVTVCPAQLPYVWNGLTFVGAGTQTVTLTNVAGCDSSATLTLSVSTTSSSTTNLSLCQNQLPYVWNGNNYNSAGSYTYGPVTNTVNCDSIAILNLTINQPSQSTTSISLCNNQLPYNWNGTIYNTAGTYTFTTTNAAGCDSFAIVNLTVTNTTQSITNVTRCNNQLPYNWNGTNYNAAGSYTFSTTNAVGCDSLAIVNLTITNTTLSITNITRCDNQLPYNWNGTNYNAAGSYTYTTTNAAGCDSLAIVNLTITNTTQSTSLVTVCPAQLPYIWNGLTFVGAGTQTATLTNVAGCDSSATLTLSVSTTSSSTTNLSLCQNQLPYVWNGNNYNSAGSYTYGPVTNSVNCDSIAILNLSINQPTQSTTSITLCNNQLPYNWNGTNYNTGGSYTFTTSNAAGCDSLAIVNLTVTNTTQSITNITLCNNQLPYNWNGTNYNSAGSYTFTTTNAAGCDSLAIVNLTVTNTTQSITNITRCNNQLPFNWNGTNYNAAGSYTFITTNAVGCDSLAIVNLTVTNTTQSITNITRCDNQLPYNWNGTNYNTAGAYTFSTTNTAGCDSLAIVNLAITNTTQSNSLVTVCPAQLPYVWNGLTFVGAGTQTATLTNVAGCDSSATLTLSVSTTSSSTTNLSLCQNQLPYVWNGTSYNSAGSYTYGPVTNSVNCDSIAILNLSINQPAQSTTSTTLCNIQLPYNWNGTNYNSAGTYTFTTTNAAGCDSLAIVNLTVTNTTQSITNITRCNNQLPYNWNGTNYNVAGSYTFTTTNAAGCDSLAIVNLTVTNTTQSTTSITRCDNQLPYNWNGTSYNAASAYTFTTTNAAGCDSLAIVNLTVTNTTQSTTNITRCNNQLPFNWNGTNYNTAGAYTFSTTNTAGCDSLAIVNLTVTNTIQSNTNITLCNNQLPYSWNGTNYNAAGTYTFTTTNTAGCDSLAIVNLTVTNTTQSITNTTLCNNQLPYNWNGTNYNVAGAYTFTTTSASGCDSLAIVNLTITNTTQSITNITRCNNQLPYSWNGTNYNAAGTYTFTTTNTAGCDSLAIVNLTVTNTTQSITSITRCNNQLPYNWNGINYNAAGSYTFTTTNAAGCDSLAIVNLLIRNTTQSITNIIRCNNQLPYNWNGTNYNAAGAYTFATINTAGCDSLAIVNLSITNTTQSITSVTRCNNQLPYNWNGTNYNAAGSYTFSTTNAAGCDSLAIVNLTVTNTTQSITNITRCDNQLPFNWNGTNYNAAGSYTFTSTNTAGCDSLAIVNLTVTNTTQSATNITRCNNQLPYNWNGTNYNAAGSYTFTTTNNVGCDSLAIVNLTVTNTSQSITNITRCNNQLPYNWNGTNYNTSGSYTFNTTNAAGCDSLAIVNLTIAFTTTSTTSINICSNELPYLWNGQSFTLGGTHIVTLVNNNGCDSIATLQLTVNLTPIKPQVISNQTICQNAVSQPLTATGSYPLIWYSSPTGGIGSSIPPVPSTNVPGIYHFYVSQINGNCESPRNEITIRVVRKPQLGNDVEQHICYGTYFNLNSVYNTGNQNIVWTTNNTVVTNPSSINTSGNYQLVLTNSFGCNDTAIVNLIVQPQLTANAGPDDIAIYNDPYQLNGSGGNQYLWSPASVLNNPSAANPLAVLTDDTQFILTISDSYGCSDKDTVFIRVLQGPSFYIPNAFTPNGDGLNDNFKPTYVGIQRLDYFRVFDRYGVLVFETNNMGKAWDGLFKSMKQNAGNFVYIVKGIDKYGKEKVLKGNVLLIR